MIPPSSDPERVAVVAPLGRDAEIISGLLRDDGLSAESFANLPALLPTIDGSGAAVVTEEAFQASDIAALVAAIEAQPPWSDLPFILLTRRGAGQERNAVALRQMRALGNVTFLERPFHPTTFVSVIRTALASRRRQYQARDRLVAIEASRAEVERSGERLSFALRAGHLGAWELDLVTRELITSPLCRTQYGRPEDEDFPYEAFLATIHADDRQMMRDAVDAAIASRTDYEVDYRIVTAPGETRWIEIRGRATYEGDRAVRMAGVSLDVTARKAGEERQNLLIRELHHRVKNTLATVQAIVGSTARGATSVEDFYRDFTGRIISLANTHTILTEEFWQRASLKELLDQELGPYGSADGRVRTEGPAVELPSDYAVPLGMAFHELTTNAAKYGALSTPEGRVLVAWQVDADDPGHTLRLAWTESDGPAVAPPTRSGFGTRLLERVLTAQLGAKVQTNFAPGGLSVQLSFALPDPRPEATLAW